jgi:hypothetical protein
VSAVTVALDRVVRYTPFGVRFRDVATGQTVSEGLELTEVGTKIKAVANRSDVFVASGFPGLSDVERPSDGPEPYLVPHDEPPRAAGSPPSTREFTFELVDTLQRFLGFRFAVHLPATNEGLLGLECTVPGSPPWLPTTDIPLYSAPSRLAPGGMATLRADLAEAAGRAPAAHAVLEVFTTGGPRFRGIADETGRVVVIFPYPEPAATAGSPPSGTTRALSYQTWNVELAARYAHPASPPAGAGARALDICTVLGQPQRPLLTGTSPATPLTQATLAFGQELVLGSPGKRMVYVA